MNPFNFYNVYFRNSFYPKFMRGIRIPKNLWPIKHYPENPKQKKRQTLCLKEYKRLKKRKYYIRTTSYRKIRKLLHKKRLSWEAQMRVYQPSHEELKWNFIDIPDKLKEHFTAQLATQVLVMPIITTDMPPAYHFDELEQSYLSYLDGNGDC